MMKIVVVLSVIAFTFFAIGCHKDGVSGAESELYGSWSKGTNFGDTLQFMRKNGRNIMRKGESFNAGVPVYSETEYSFGNGKFGLKFSNWRPISSFAWTQPNVEFSILGFQVYLFMSSSTTVFTFRKI